MFVIITLQFTLKLPRRFLPLLEFLKRLIWTHFLFPYELHVTIKLHLAFISSP